MECSCNNIENINYKELCNKLSLEFTGTDKSFTLLTGNKDLDIQIINDLPDKDLINICFVNKYAHNLCNIDALWLRRFMKQYGKHFDSVNEIIEWKGNNSWKDYYLWVADTLSGDDPYFISAQAMEMDRGDILKLLPAIRGIENVKLTIKYYPNGKQREKYYLQPDGKKVGRFLRWHENGQLKMDKWNRYGPFKEYYDTGQLKNYSNIIKDGKHNGVVKKYFRNGNLEFIGNMIMNKLDGLAKQYYENGKLVAEANYVNGVKNGSVKDYHENGNIDKEGEYLYGNKYGIWKCYDVDGKLIKEEEYGGTRKI